MASSNIPEATATVQVSIIDTTCRLKNLPTAGFLGPPAKGLETFDAVTYAFLITHTDASTGKQRRVVFDLGPPKDWEHDIGEVTANRVKSWGANIKITKYVSEILEEGQVPLDSVEGLIWSHAHWDHIGRPSLFPESTALLAHSAIRTNFYPGSPTVATSAALERDLAGRELIDLEFDSSQLTIGGLKAIDFFNDGSFYLLSAPGHAVGHIIALARTTSPALGESSKPTFILMTADSFHHAAQLRPNKHLPLPETIPGPLPNLPQYTTDVPTEIFHIIHPSHPRRRAEMPQHYATEMEANNSDFRTTPFLTVASTADGHSLAVDLAGAKETIKALQAFDADENVLVLAAHDGTMFDTLEYFPEEANEWKTKGWKERGQWLFLGDLAKAVEIANSKV